MRKEYREKKKYYALLAAFFLITTPFIYHKLSNTSTSLKKVQTPEFKATANYQIKATEKSELIRALPYPFKNAVSLADDVDGSHWQGDIAIQDDLFDKYGFNIGRSMFIYMPKIDTDFIALTSQETALESDSIINLPPFENSTYYLLRRYYDGGIDYIHMWSTFEKLQNQTAIIDKQNVKVTVKDKSQVANKKIPIFRNSEIFPAIFLECGYI